MRYYFHTANGSGYRDREGTEHADVRSARRHAIIYAGECMHLDPDVLSEHKFQVEVTDETGFQLFTVVVAVCDAPQL